MLEAYLLLFLQSSPALKHTHDLEHIASRTLNTHVLGEHVAPSWGLGRILRWTPPLPAKTLMLASDGTGEEKANVGALRSVGLYKVQGETVQAVMGGIFHQFVSWPLEFASHH